MRSEWCDFEGLASEFKLLSNKFVKESKKYESVMTREGNVKKRLKTENLALKGKLSEVNYDLTKAQLEIASLKRELEEKKSCESPAENKSKDVLLSIIFELGNSIKVVTEESSDKRTDKSPLLKYLSNYSREKFIDICKSGDFKKIKRLFSPSKIKVNSSFMNTVLNDALFVALKDSDKNMSLINLLLANGARPGNKSTSNIRSLLHAVSLKNSDQLFDLVLPHYSIADLDSVDVDGYSPFHLACKYKKLTSMKRLIEAGCDINLLSINELKKSPKDLFFEQNSKSFVLQPSKNSKIFENIDILLTNLSKRGLFYSSQQKNLKAIEIYTQGIDLLVSNRHKSRVDDDLSRLFLNRGRLRVRIGLVYEALKDSEESTNLDKSYIKGYQLRLECNKLIFHFKDALQNAQRLLSLDHNNREIWMKEINFLRLCSDASHYDILKIARDSKNSDIKRAFKVESMKWHPDKHMNSKSDHQRAQNQFKKINAAKMILTDSYERSIYDQTYPGKLKCRKLLPWMLDDKCKLFSAIYAENLDREQTEQRRQEEEDSEVDGFIDLTQDSEKKDVDAESATSTEAEQEIEKQPSNIKVEKEDEEKVKVRDEKSSSEYKNIKVKRTQYETPKQFSTPNEATPEADTPFPFNTDTPDSFDFDTSFFSSAKNYKEERGKKFSIGGGNKKLYKSKIKGKRKSVGSKRRVLKPVNFDISDSFNGEFPSFMNSASKSKKKFDFSELFGKTEPQFDTSNNVSNHLFKGKASDEQ